MVQVEIGGALEVKQGVPARWWNAALPIGLVVFLMLLGLILTGKDAVDADPELESNAENIFGQGNSYKGIFHSQSSLPQTDVSRDREHDTVNEKL